MNTAFLRLAYERTTIAACRRHLMEKYLEGGGGLKEALICEEVAYSIREVPNEVIAEVIQRLEAEEKRITDEMAQYELRKRDERPPIAQRKPDPAEQPEGEEGGEAGGPPPAARRKGRKSRGDQQGAG